MTRIVLATLALVASFGAPVLVLAQQEATSQTVCCQTAVACSMQDIDTCFQNGGKTFQNSVCGSATNPTDRTCIQNPVSDQQPIVADPKLGPKVIFVPNISIPGSDFQAGVETEVTGKTLGDYVAAVYVWFAGAAGTLAVFMSMYAGFQWITAAGNAGRISEAKDTLTGAIVGLILLLGSYVLLNTISPQFVNLKDLSDIARVESLTLGLAPHGSLALEDRAGQIPVQGQYNQAGCPSVGEMAKGFSGFVTAYYRPSTTDPGLYKNTSGALDSMCNIAMQCSCPTTGSLTCSPTKGWPHSWAPCDPAKLGNNYCNRTASGVAPRAFVSAAGSNCFGFGTTFEVTGGVDFSITSADWVVQDRGPAIRGRHFDLFLGDNKQLASTLADTVTVKVKKFCPNLASGKPGTCQTITP